MQPTSEEGIIAIADDKYDKYDKDEKDDEEWRWYEEK